MIQLYKLLFEICRFQAKPQDLPSSYVFKYLTIASYAAVALGLAMLSQRMAFALLSVFVETAMLVGLGYAGLWVRNLTGRSTQTITALAGTGTIIGVVGFPILAWVQNSGNTLSILATAMLLLVNVWNVVVIGHILRHALSLQFWVSIGIAMFYVFTTIRVMSVLYIVGS